MQVAPYAVVQLDTSRKEILSGASPGETAGRREWQHKEEPIFEVNACLFVLPPSPPPTSPGEAPAHIALPLLHYVTDPCTAGQGALAVPAGIVDTRRSPPARG